MHNTNYYITTPIYYVNDAPHIGHAYTSLACDVAARFMRMDKKQVKFLTGTDEHGQKVEKAAAAMDVETKEFVDANSAKFRSLAAVMNFSNDDFLRTTEERHIKAAQGLWITLRENGWIYEGKYAGWYSVRDEAFFAADELVEGKAPTGAPVEWVEEPSYFFKLSAWGDKLLELYKNNPNFIYPESRRNEVISFVKGGLHDLSISRTTFKWGIKVPDCPGHVMYVWMDALTNYITTLGYPADTKDMRDFWPQAIHVVGKDILRFHAVYWPAFLMAAGLEPPKRVIAHGWWTNEGQKISKSLGNVIDPIDLVQNFGLDQTRYFLLREVPFGSDGNYAQEAMINRINAELANNFGNLAQRTLAFIAKNCGGVVPEPSVMTDADVRLLQNAAELLEVIRLKITDFKFSEILEAVINLSNQANAYIDTEAPWSLRKTDPTRMNTVLYVLLEAIRHIYLYLLPFMPQSAAKTLAMLGVQPDNFLYKYVGESGRIKPGQQLPAPMPIFPRYG